MKSLKGRVHVVKTEGGWVQLHKKSGSRFVFVSFGAVSNQQSPPPFFLSWSRHAELHYVAVQLCYHT